MAAFIDVCYLVRQNEISSSDLNSINAEITQFHRLRQVFIDSGVRTSTSLPRQHALFHYADSIVLFGSPNGLCSSITEAKHIKSVKEPWRRSNRNNPLPQMLHTITRMEKMAALRVVYSKLGMFCHSNSTSMGEMADDGNSKPDTETQSLSGNVDVDDIHIGEPHCENAEVGASDESETSIKLAVKRRASNKLVFSVFIISQMKILQSLSILANSMILPMQSDARNFPKP